MKYSFIVNPKAGQGKGNDNLIEKIKMTAKEMGKEISVHVTAGVGDATVIANKLCEENEDTRIIVCGGDGTFNEVVNGCVDYDVPIGIIPVGTGNDFIRNFGVVEDFLNIENQFNYEPTKLDVIKYSYDNNVGYCTNVINIGFDGNVAILAGKLKTIPLIAGSFAYLSSIIFNLITKKGQNLMVYSNEEKIHEGPLLLCSVGNGKYCGGGICNSPRADLRDGLMDLEIVDNVSRRIFLKLLPSYIKGKILDMPEIGDKIRFKQTSKITIKPKAREMEYCIDGEPIKTGELVLEAISNKLNFLVKSC